MVRPKMQAALAVRLCPPPDPHLCPCAVLQSVEARVPADRQFLGSLLGGISAGFAASFVRVPTEVIKQRMQTGGAARACCDSAQGHAPSCCGGGVIGYLADAFPGHLLPS